MQYLRQCPLSNKILCCELAGHGQHRGVAASSHWSKHDHPHNLSSSESYCIVKVIVRIIFSQTMKGSNALEASVFEGCLAKLPPPVFTRDFAHQAERLSRPNMAVDEN